MKCLHRSQVLGVRTLTSFPSVVDHVVPPIPTHTRTSLLWWLEQDVLTSLRHLNTCYPVGAYLGRMRRYSGGSMSLRAGFKISKDPHCFLYVVPVYGSLLPVFGSCLWFEVCMLSCCYSHLLPPLCHHEL